MSAFDELLYRLVQAKGLSLREFAEKVGYHHTIFSQIKAGQRPVPVARAKEWAVALGLPRGTPTYERFVDLAALTTIADGEARERFERLLPYLDQLERQAEELARRVEDLERRPSTSSSRPAR